MIDVTRPLSALAIGAAATLSLDLWNVALARTVGVRSLDFCLLGRWVGHLPRGVVRHRSIAAAARRRGECLIGWATHYAIGATLALVFAQWVAPTWLDTPTFAPALAYGVATFVFPFFVLHPALGFGIASAATRSPARSRLKSLATHVVYGSGLYLWGRVAAWLLA